MSDIKSYPATDTVKESQRVLGYDPSGAQTISITIKALREYIEINSSLPADQVTFDPDGTAITATDVQGALEYIDTILGTLGTAATSDLADLNNKFATVVAMKASIDTDIIKAGNMLFTVDNNSTARGGGADYLVKTAAQASTDSDAIDGSVNHASGVSGLELILQHNGIITTFECGINGDATDESVAMQRMMNSGASHFKFPRTSKYYMFHDVEVPEGSILNGDIYRPNSAQSSVVDIEGFGACVKPVGETNLFIWNRRCVIGSMFFYGQDRLGNAFQMKNVDTGNLTILNSAVHRFDRGLGTSGYLRTTDIYNTHFINNNYGCRNVIDARAVSCVFKSNQVNGTLLQTGANANNFAECRWEFDVGEGFVTSSASSNSIIGGLIDRAGSSGIRAISSELTVSGTIMRRNGRFNLGADECAHIYSEDSALVIDGVKTSSGDDDGGGGDTTPNYTISAEGGVSTITGAGNDFSGFVTSALREGTTLNAVLKANKGIEDYDNQSLLQSVNSEVFYTKQNSGNLATSATFLASYKLPTIATFQRNLFTIQMVLRSSTGSTRHGVIQLVQRREAGGAAIDFGVFQESVAGTFGTTATEDIQFTFSNVATDGSTFDITFTNNDVTTWKVFSTLIK